MYPAFWPYHWAPLQLISTHAAPLLPAAAAAGPYYHAQHAEAQQLRRALAIVYPHVSRLSRVVAHLIDAGASAGWYASSLRDTAAAAGITEAGVLYLLGRQSCFMVSTAAHAGGDTLVQLDAADLLRRARLWVPSTPPPVCEAPPPRAQAPPPPAGCRSVPPAGSAQHSRVQPQPLVALEHPSYHPQRPGQQPHSMQQPAVAAEAPAGLAPAAGPEPPPPPAAAAAPPAATAGAARPSPAAEPPPAAAASEGAAAPAPSPPVSSTQHSELELRRALALAFPAASVKARVVQHLLLQNAGTACGLHTSLLRDAAAAAGASPQELTQLLLHDRCFSLLVPAQSGRTTLVQLNTAALIQRAAAAEQQAAAGATLECCSAPPAAVQPPRQHHARRPR